MYVCVCSASCIHITWINRLPQLGIPRMCSSCDRAANDIMLNHAYSLIISDIAATTAITILTAQAYRPHHKATIPLTRHNNFLCDYFPVFWLASVSNVPCSSLETGKDSHAISSTKITIHYPPYYRAMCTDSHCTCTIITIMSLPSSYLCSLLYTQHTHSVMIAPPIFPWGIFPRWTTGRIHDGTTYKHYSMTL